MTKYYAKSLKDLRVHQKAREVGEALECGYLSPADADELNSGLEEIGRMLNSMMVKSDTFCGPHGSSLHESAAEHFTSADHRVTDH